MRQFLIAAFLLVGLAASSSAQSLPPPQRSASAWDTQLLVNEAHFDADVWVRRLRALVRSPAVEPADQNDLFSPSA